MKVCVFGAGAVGGHLAWRLHQGGADVSLVARGAHLAAIKRYGLIVHLGDGSEHDTPLAASADPRDLGPQDFVIVSVKAPALPEVARTIAPLLREDTTVVFMMNGIPWWYFHAHGGEWDGRRLPRLDPEDAVWKAVGPARTVGGVIYTACNVSAPGVVHVEAGPEKVILGEPNGSHSSRAETLAQALRRGGMTTVISETIRDDIWTKLISNISNGTLCVASQSNFKTLYAEAAPRQALRQLIAEGQDIAAALGRKVDIDAEEVLRRLENNPHKPSILQDYERGRPMEVDAVYRIPLEMARMAKVKTPLLDLMVSLLTLRAKAAGLYQP